MHACPQPRGHVCGNQREAGDEKADAGVGAKCHTLFLRGQKRRVAPRLFIRGTVIGPRLRPAPSATLISFPLLPASSPNTTMLHQALPRLSKAARAPLQNMAKVSPSRLAPPLPASAKHIVGPILLLRDLPTRPGLPDSRLRLHPCSRRFCRVVRPSLRPPLLARGVCQQRRRERFAPCRVAV